MTQIIFDCDGVLINSTELRTDAALSWLHRIGLKISRDTYVENFMGLTTEAWTARISAEMQKQQDSALPSGFVQQLDAYVEALFKDQLAPLPGALDLVARLGEPRCVASNTSYDFLCWKLRQTELFDLFEPNIYSGDMVPEGKPAPDLFQLAASNLGRNAAECVVIEDSANGIRAAKAAAMTAIGFTLGGHCGPEHGDRLKAAGADRIVASFEELDTVLKESFRSPQCS